MNYTERVKKIEQQIIPYIRRTPLLKSDYYSSTLSAEVFFKCENLQYTGAFKVRGAFSKVMAIKDQGKKLVTASGGNHGMGVAFAAKTFGLEAVVVLLKFAPAFRIAALKALGAEVVVYGETMDDLNAKCAEYTQTGEYVYIHPFDDDDVIAGQGTVAQEILEDMPDADILIASIGGGGLISGISQYAKAFNPSIKVYGVQTQGANAMAESVQAGSLVAIPAITSVATSLGATKVTERTFDIVRQYVENVSVVSDEATLHELRQVLEKEKMLIEPAAACNLAALTAGKIPVAGKKVVVVMCGGNVSLDQLKGFL